jgi:hypothetical protein
MAVLIERYHNAKVNQIPEVKAATETAKLGIDSFRKANALKAKLEKLVVKEEEVLQKDLPQG